MRVRYTLGAALAAILLSVCSGPTAPAQRQPFMVWRANEPAGMTPLINSPFDSVATTAGQTFEGWTYYRVVGLSGTSDANAPVSAPSVVQFVFTPAQAYGSGPGGALSVNVPAGYTKLYIDFAVRLSPGFFGPGHQKLFYIYGAGNSPLPAAVVEYRVPQSSAGPVYPFVETENTGGGDGNYWSMNQGDIGSRGDWHMYEVYIQLNDPGVANGQLKFWVDGAEQEYRDGTMDPAHFQLIPAGGAKRFQTISFDPTYGGGGTPMPPPGTQYIYLDHVYISASN